MTISEKKKFDLPDRTLNFAWKIRKFIQGIKNKNVFIEDKKQLIRSSASVGANYLEANEGISHKDFLLRLRISKKEAVESSFWLKLIQRSLDADERPQAAELIDEADQLARILGAILSRYR